MKCPNCGKEITDDSLFCEHCGAKIEKKAAAPKTAKTTGISWKKIGSIIVTVLVIAVGALKIARVVIRSNRSSKSKTEQVSKKNNNNSNVRTNVPQQQASYDDNYYGGGYYGDAVPAEEDTYLEYLIDEFVSACYSGNFDRAQEVDNMIDKAGYEETDLTYEQRQRVESAVQYFQDNYYGVDAE